MDSVLSVKQLAPEGGRRRRRGGGIFLITPQQYRYHSRDDIKYNAPGGKLDTLEGKHVVMTAESSKRN